MAYRFGRRVAVPAQRRAVSRAQPFVAPVRGLVTNENLARSGGNSARISDNWFFNETGARIRGGSPKYATLGGTAVTAMFSYTGPTLTRKLFAADASNIYDISAVADPDVAVTAAVSSLTSGDWSTTQFSTIGGDYLIAVNGADAARLYDGSSWGLLSGTFTVNFSDSTTLADLSYVFAHKGRLFYLKDGSFDVHYMPVAAVGGDASLLTLNSIFERGGALLFGTTWSKDSGSGPDDLAIFVTTEGELAVYLGTDPSSAFDWNLVGLYRIGKPLGKHAWFRAGGDVLIATEDGVVPLSQVVNRDPAALELSAVSRNIEPDWRTEFNARNSTAWQMLKWTARSMGLVSLPHRTADPVCFVVNLETGAWTRFTGWDIQAMSTYGDQAFFGDSGGVIYQMDAGGQDDESAYLCRLSYHNDHLGEIGTYKVARMIRATFRANADFIAKLSLATNYAEDFPTAPSAAPASTTAEAIWDTGIWDESKWDDASTSELKTTTTAWRSVNGTGYAFAPQIQITSGQTRKANIELVQLELIFEKGALVV